MDQSISQQIEDILSEKEPVEAIRLIVDEFNRIDCRERRNAFVAALAADSLTQRLQYVYR